MDGQKGRSKARLITGRDFVLIYGSRENAGETRYSWLSGFLRLEGPLSVGLCKEKTHRGALLRRARACSADETRDFVKSGLQGDPF